MSLKTTLATQIANALRRKSVATCSDYAQHYRIMGKPVPGPFSFKYHPWSRGMHDSNAYKNVGQKSAQGGFTEVCINRTFYKIDIEHTDCLYVLPNKNPDASDFSSARFQPALELSPHLKTLFNDVQNVGHKRAGACNLYIRGSRSRSGLRSLPAGFMVLDEFDEMDQEQVSLAIERMSGQFDKQLWEISTPTIPNKKINKEFLGSTQEHFFFKCPYCSRSIELTYPDSFVLTAQELNDPKIHDSHLICNECKHKLIHETKYEWLQTGVWVPTVKSDPDVRGFHINQLYSSTVSPVELARSIITASYDPTEEQTLYNDKLGLPHIVDGARVTDVQIDSCILKGYKMSTQAEPHKIVTMGVDVGSFLHCEIVEWDIQNFGPDINTNAKARVLFVHKLRQFDELDNLMKDFQVKGCVVDVNPERRKAKEFADRFYGYVKLAYYGRGITSKGIKLGGGDHDIIADHQMTIDRTSWLDAALGRFMKGTIILPYDIPEEYRENIKNQVKIFKKDNDGGPIARYESTGPDHYGHARVYSEAALPLAASTMSHSDIKNFL